MFKGLEQSQLDHQKSVVGRQSLVVSRWSFGTRRSFEPANDRRPATDDCLPTKNRRDRPTLYGPLNGEGVPVSPEHLSVTEVCLPGKSFHPGPLRLADAPGTRHPARSLATTRSW